MSYKTEFIPFAVSLLSEFGFKSDKKLDVAIHTMGNLVLEIRFAGRRGKEVHFSCSVLNEFFAELDFKLTGSNYWGNALINILTNHAFPRWDEDLEFSGQIDFECWQNKNGLSFEEARKEFERLFLGFILPWFERHKTYEGIRRTHREGALSGKLWDKAWSNTDFTPRDGGQLISGSLFQTFYIDVLISRLIGDDMRPVNDIYEEFYKDGYEKMYSKIDEKTGKARREGRVGKLYFDALPSIIQRIDSVTEKEWEEYRELTGIGII